MQIHRSFISTEYTFILENSPLVHGWSSAGKHKVTQGIQMQREVKLNIQEIGRVICRLVLQGK